MSNISTSDFRTSQQFIPVSFPHGNHYIIAIDKGYSSTKVACENMIGLFPSFVKELGPFDMTLNQEKDIVYTDLSDGKRYMVGYQAQKMITQFDTNTVGATDRQCYTTQDFKICVNVAIALCLMAKKTSDKREVFIESGLAAAWMGDTSKLIKATSKPTHFMLKIGAEKEQEFQFEINGSKVDVIEQPRGSFISALYKSNGNFCQKAQKILTGRTLVIDGGFNTMDLYGFQNTASSICASLDENAGMKAVLEELIQKIKKNTGESYTIATIQDPLEVGHIIAVDEEDMRQVKVPINDLLEEASETVFRANAEKIRSATTSFRGYETIILTGGTMSAWNEKFRQYLSGMSNIELLDANSTDPSIPLTLCNVRGYYFYRLMKDKGPSKSTKME